MLGWHDTFFGRMKNEAGSAKWASTRIKKGQQTKIRFYCGLCQTACKDENGYKCHLETEGHIHRELAVQESLRSFKLSKEDKVFRRKFLQYLVSKHFGQTCLAHEVYKDLYPLDRGHNIVKATCWETLGVFVAQLRKEGRVEAQKGLKGWQVRVSSSDFHDDDEDNKETSGDGKQSEGKRKKSHSSVSLKIAKLPMQEHSEATGRVGDQKVAFTLASIPSNSSARRTQALPSPFSNNSSEDEDDDAD